MKPSLRVLVVDDNPMNLELVGFLLSGEHFEVATAADAAQALSKLAGFGPELILMDIQLPGMDGLQLMHRLKSDPATRHIKIVAFTAYAMKGDEQRMLQAGCDGYLPKPIEVATFAAQVSAIAALPRAAPG